MVKVMYNDKLIYKVVIWVFFGISLWKEKEALIVSRLYTLLEKGTCRQQGGTVNVAHSQHMQYAITVQVPVNSMCMQWHGVTYGYT